MSNKENTALRLKQAYLDAIMADEELRAKVAKACDKSSMTIYRWVRADSQELTMLSIINALREYLKIDKSVSLTEYKPKVNA